MTPESVVVRAHYAHYTLALHKGNLDVLPGGPKLPTLGPRRTASTRTPGNRGAGSALGPAPASSTVRSYRLGDRFVTLAAGPRFPVDLIDSLWSPYRVAHAPPTAHVLHATRAGSSFRVDDGRSAAQLSSELALKGHVQQSIIESIYGDGGWLAVLHAGAVSLRGELVAIAGTPRAGKSTLVAGLSRGGFRYFSDDCVPVALDDERACSVPTALSLRQGSWAAVADRLPELASIAARERGADIVKYWAPAEQLAGAFRREPVRWLIYPRFAPSEQPSVRRLEPLEALRRFVQSGSSPGRQVDEWHLRRFAAWLERLDHAAISYRSLDEATEQIARIVAS